MSAALEMRIAVSRVETRSAFVPETLAVHADSIDLITRLAQVFKMEVYRLPAEPFLIYPGRDLTNYPPRIGYTVEPKEIEGKVELTRRWRRGAPSFWTVKSGEIMTWTHFPEAAHFWAQVLGGTIQVDQPTLLEFSLGSSCLPLAAARWLDTVGGVRSGPLGPDDKDTHVYSAPTLALKERFLAALERFEVQNVDAMRRMSEED